MNDFADLHSHRIEGIAKMGNKPFSVSLFSHIEGNLWQGGCPVDYAPAEFQFIISLYPWGKYNHAEHTIYTECYLYDHEGLPDLAVLNHLADYVNACRKIGTTLVHCQAGLNRSSLVSGVALIREGMEPAKAIELLRSKRCDAVLCNEAFERFLLSYAT